MALSNAFSSLKSGDLIQASDDKGGETIVIVRVAAFGRLVLGRICKCGKHVDHVYFETFSWNSKAECLVDTIGRTPTWWSADATKEADAGAKFLTEEVLSVPAESDFPWCSTRQRDELLEGRPDFVKQARAAHTIGELDSKSFVLHLLRTAGVSVSDEQANLVFGALSAIAGAEEAKGVELLAEMFDSLADALRSGTVRH